MTRRAWTLACRCTSAVIKGGWWVPVPKVRTAAAAAILSSQSLSVAERQALGDPRFYVHDHVERVAPDDEALAV